MKAMAEHAGAPQTGADPTTAGRAPTQAQRAYLVRAMDQPGGKLPLFDLNGKPVDTRVIRACLAQGWAEPWFSNPLKPDWIVCRITAKGRVAIGGLTAIR
jgi:hypothetical protein